MSTPPTKIPNLSISKSPNLDPSWVIKQEIAAIQRVFKTAADNNVTGPEATVLRRIDSRAKKALPRIIQLENRLKNIGPGNRSLITKQLRDEVENLLREIEMDTLEIRMNLNAPPGTMERLKQKLPRWLQDRIKEGMKHGGVPIGVGAVRPAKVKSPAGAKSKGVMPNGLEWLYSW